MHQKKFEKKFGRNFSEINRYRNMGKGKKIAIVGCGASGITTLLTTILAERGLTTEDIIIIDSETMKDKDKVMEILNTSDKPVLIEDTNLLIENPKQEIFTITDPYEEFRNQPMYYPTRKEIEEYHPFSKFIGKGKNKRGRGRM